MKVLFIVTLLSFFFVVNAKISDEVLKCRWDIFGEDIAVLYIDIEHPEMPRQDIINRFCQNVNQYQKCVAAEEKEQMTVELMEGMCEYGFEAAYNNITCLQKAAVALKTICSARRGNCETSYEWFECSQSVTQDLCGEILGFVMATLQPLYCQIFEAMQFDELQQYNIDETALLEAETQGPTKTTRPRTTQGPTKTIQPRTTQGPTKTIQPRTTQGPTKTIQPRTTQGPTKTIQPRTTQGPTKTIQPRTTEGPTKTSLPRTTQGPTKTIQPHTTQGPTKTIQPRTTQGPTKTIQPRTTQGPTKITRPRTTQGPTKKPITTRRPQSTTNSGISNLPSSVSYVLSIVVATYMMKNV